MKQNEVDHIWFLKGTSGGHRSIYVTNDLNGSEMFKIVSRNEINTDIPLNLRTKITKVNDHTFYENLYRYNANGKGGVLNNQNTTKKAKHFVISDNWTKQRLTEEMTYAYTNRRIDKKKGFYAKDKKNGVVYSTIESIYKSSFSDGTKIQIIHRGVDIDPITKDAIKDHISLLSIKP